MYYLRKANDRGHIDHGWLDTYHTFSFGDYYDPKHMGFRALRVINEDTVAGGIGFPMHGHKDMEIVTYVTEGALQHEDTLGTFSVIEPGELQRMSAGTGIKHSEMNADEKKPVHLLQIWLMTEKEGIPPSYDQVSFKKKAEKEKFFLIGSKVGAEDAVSIHQDVKIYRGQYSLGEGMSFDIPKNRHAWIQVVKGDVRVNDQDLSRGDGLGISDMTKLEIKSLKDSEFLLFDLP
ncbi:MAG: pirin family protein [Bdellovibrionota bacterium]